MKPIHFIYWRQPAVQSVLIQRTPAEQHPSEGQHESRVSRGVMGGWVRAMGSNTFDLLQDSCHWFVQTHCERNRLSVFPLFFNDFSHPSLFPWHSHHCGANAMAAHPGDSTWNACGRTNVCVLLACYKLTDDACGPNDACGPLDRCQLHWVSDSCVLLLVVFDVTSYFCHCSSFKLLNTWKFVAPPLTYTQWYGSDHCCYCCDNYLWPSLCYQLLYLYMSVGSVRYLCSCS